MNRQSDVNCGRATVVRHNDGGWALPGGKITHSALEATETAEKIDAIITANSGMNPGPAAQAPAVITRRQVSGNDAVRHTVSA